MAFLLDTNIAIHLTEGTPDIVEKIAALQTGILLSVISRIELEGGVHAAPADALARRARLDKLLERVPVLPFDTEAADAYRRIIEATGFSRRKIIDRMIAGQALAHDATLVTRNGADFRDVPGLRLLEW